MNDESTKEELIPCLKRQAKSREIWQQPSPLFARFLNNGRTERLIVHHLLNAAYTYSNQLYSVPDSPTEFTNHQNATNHLRYQLETVNEHCRNVQ